MPTQTVIFFCLIFSSSLLPRPQTLCDVLCQGVAYMHEGLNEIERKAVETLFNNGAIQVGGSLKPRLTQFVQPMLSDLVVLLLMKRNVKIFLLMCSHVHLQYDQNESSFGEGKMRNVLLEGSFENWKSLTMMEDS